MPLLHVITCKKNENSFGIQKDSHCRWFRDQYRKKMTNALLDGNLLEKTSVASNNRQLPTGNAYINAIFLSWCAHMIEYTQGVLDLMERQFWLYYNESLQEATVIDDSQGSEDNESEASENGKSDDSILTDATHKTP